MRLAVNYQSVDPSRGGAETYVADLCRRLISLGHEVDLYAAEWSADALPVGLNVIEVPALGLTRGARIRNFGEASEALIPQERYDCTVGFINTWAHDVLIPQGGVRQASLEFNARRFPEGWKRGAYRFSKRLNPRHGLYRAIEARQYDPNRSATIVAVSRFVQGHLERYHHVPAERIRVIPNAIDAGRLQVENAARVREEFRREHGLSATDLVGLFVGHNFKLKGLPDLLKSLKLRLEGNPQARPVHLLVCGGGKIEPFRKTVESLGLSQFVKLIGFAKDIKACYHASDFFALPSYYDPCSLVVFEALACGMPVITTACNGAGEVMTEGREGFVVPSPEDHQSLASALDRMTDDAARKAMSRHAETLGKAQSFDNHVSRLLAVFEEAAARRSPRVRSRVHPPHRVNHERSSPEVRLEDAAPPR
jgi:UDP-glucose:(heptosyl)LPS alpha-1,3-glucosyltransferase